ncbi:MAG: 3-phosphoshikimate 1-carboxyvinyltransferase [Desulfotomaculum sp. 46_296]|nr:MAG: 3-phosphoshikimate 1-carboxyvinyltransferase [Desulfotomaculum sp. 46_296]HAU31755.1 3-phosphoshikimate 1-carboxyvinyltransferase [Desulfotomaculum sp.]
MEFRIKSSAGLRGTISVPGDKSISHRAVMLGSLAEGETYIENFLTGADCLATMSCFRLLGVEFDGPNEKGDLVVHGNGPLALREPEQVLNAANSGTTMRLLLGILSGLPFFSVLTGDASLRSRPMSRVTVPLSLMGARIWGRHEGKLAPLAVQGGNCTGIKYSLPVASAQVKSAILLAGLLASGETEVTEPFQSRDHTERMLKLFGAELTVDGKAIRIRGKQKLKGQRVVVTGDISSAAFFLAAGASVPGSDLTIKDVGVNPTRCGILEVMEQMGADITVFNRREVSCEPVADIRVKYSKLKGATIGGELIPRLIDEVPVLAVLGTVAEGEILVKDAAELKVKESNRIAVLAGELRKLNAAVEELPDGLAIQGGRPLKAAVCESHGDHRIAMAMAIAGLLAQGQTIVKNTECVDVSFPGFFKTLCSLG